MKNFQHLPDYHGMDPYGFHEILHIIIFVQHTKLGHLLYIVCMPLAIIIYFKFKLQRNVDNRNFDQFCSGRVIIGILKSSKIKENTGEQSQRFYMQDYTYKALSRTCVE